MQRPRRVTDLVSSNNPTQQACALLRMVQLPLFETHVTRLWRASGPVALNEKRDGRQTWTHWDLNPGPSACEADVIPLHHVPSAPARGYWLILANTKPSCLCKALGKNSCYNGNVTWEFQAMRDIDSGKHKERHRKRHPPWGSNPRPQG